MQCVSSSLAESSGEARLEIVVFVFPGGHVLGDALLKRILPLLLQLILRVKFALLFIVGVKILLITLEDFGVGGQVLLVGSPLFGTATFFVTRVVLVKVGRADVLVINSVLDVLEVFVCDRHTHLPQRLDQSILRVHILLYKSLICVVEDLSVRLFGLFAIYLRQLLHFDFMLAHYVLLFLGEVAQVSSRTASPDLARRNFRVGWNDGAGRNHSERFDTSSALHSGAHANEGVIFERARVKANISPHVHVLSNDDLVALLLRQRPYTRQILQRRIFANRNRSLISTQNDTVPQARSLAQLHITDHCSVRSNPVGLKRNL